jgi:hypothetical protein
MSCCPILSRAFFRAARRAEPRGGAEAIKGAYKTAALAIAFPGGRRNPVIALRG